MGGRIAMSGQSDLFSNEVRRWCGILGIGHNNVWSPSDKKCVCVALMTNCALSVIQEQTQTQTSLENSIMTEYATALDMQKGTFTPPTGLTRDELLNISPGKPYTGAKLWSGWKDTAAQCKKMHAEFCKLCPTGKPPSGDQVLDAFSKFRQALDVADKATKKAEKEKKARNKAQKNGAAAAQNATATPAPVPPPTTPAPEMPAAEAHMEVTVGCTVYLTCDQKGMTAGTFVVVTDVYDATHGTLLEVEDATSNSGTRHRGIHIEMVKFVSAPPASPPNTEAAAGDAPRGDPLYNTTRLLSYALFGAFSKAPCPIFMGQLENGKGENETEEEQAAKTGQSTAYGRSTQRKIH